MAGSDIVLTRKKATIIGLIIIVAFGWILLTFNMVWNNASEYANDVSCQNGIETNMKNLRLEMYENFGEKLDLKLEIPMRCDDSYFSNARSDLIKRQEQSYCEELCGYGTPSCVVLHYRHPKFTETQCVSGQTGDFLTSPIELVKATK